MRVGAISAMWAPAWTSAGEMRHPAFLGLRADKEAKDVRRERETPRKKR